MITKLSNAKDYSKLPWLCNANTSVIEVECQHDDMDMVFWMTNASKYRNINTTIGILA